MAHRHTYYRSGGCDESPGVNLVGGGVTVYAECACGASRQEWRPGPHDDYEHLVIYYDRDGRITRERRL
jgi:hypothetical protein